MIVIKLHVTPVEASLKYSSTAGDLLASRPNAADRPQEWRDRLRWVKLLRDKQPVSMVHLIVT
jgi:hypothetical protein